MIVLAQLKSKRARHESVTSKGSFQIVVIRLSSKTFSLAVSSSEG